MLRRKRLWLVILAAALPTGLLCLGFYDWGITQDDYNRITVLMNDEEVQQVLGRPDGRLPSVDRFTRNPDGHVKWWFFKRSEGLTTQKRYIARLWFYSNGKLYSHWIEAWTEPAPPTFFERIGRSVWNLLPF